MIETKDLPINSLDFDDIKQNFISFLKNQTDSNGFPVYQDVDFQASGISTLLNILSYNTHYIGYYVKMLLNESFIDSAVKRESILSKAKLTGYVPRGKTASRATIRLQIDIDINEPEQFEPSSRNILISHGTSFNGRNNEFDQRTFYNIDDVFMNEIETIGSGRFRYTSDYFTIYEGRIQEWKFKVDSNLLNQRYIIKDKNIDIDTMRVFVSPYQSTDSEIYYLARDTIDINRDSPVYYLTTQEEGYYEIVFGSNIFGKMPVHNSTVFIRYISTSGESGNGCKSFRYNALKQGLPTENNIGNWEDMIVLLDANTISSGGNEPESMDSLRFTVPHHYRRQNRLVTEDDFKQIIIGEFRNIDSLNVWGGETNFIKQYGKILISIKPKFADKLTETAKRDIENRLIKKHSVVGMEPIFIDPEFINIELEVFAKIDISKTNLTFGEIEYIISQTINEYNRTNLNVFDNFYSDVHLLNNIKLSNKAIISCYSRRKINKDQLIIYASEIENVLFIGNPLKEGIKSSHFIYGENECYYADDKDGHLYIYKADGTKLLLKSFGHIDYEKGILYYFFPSFARMIDYDFGTNGIINFTMIPRNPDIETFYQNIVRITSVRVILSNA